MQNNFNGGIISPEMYGRSDQVKYQSGVADCNNMLVLPHGALDFRNGFEYVNQFNRPFRLIPFIYSDEQAIAIILCPPYAYFSTLGQMLLNAGGTALLQVAIPYTAADLPGIRYTQSGDVVTMTHRNHAPRLLQRLGPTSWAMNTVSSSPSIAAPANASVTAFMPNTSGAHPIIHYYCVTAWKGTEESPKKEMVAAANDLSIRPNTNSIEWDAVPGAEKYTVYKRQSGVYGRIAETTELTMVDDYIEADTTLTPSFVRNVFASYPVAVSYIQQRKVYGGGANTPQALNMSRAGTEDVFTFSIPMQDDDAIQFRIAGRDGNGIQHLVPMNDLLILTSASAWKVSSNSAISPIDLMVYPQSNTGANQCTPLLADNVCIFSSDQTGRIHELSLSANKSGAYQTVELSLMCPHLFDGYTIVDQAITRNPFTCAYFVRNDGVLIGLTYDPVQQVFGFHKHTAANGGLIKTVTVIPEEGQSSLYLGIQRGTSTELFLERFRMRRSFNKIYENHLDCSIVKTFSTETTTVTGLDWLNGKSVSVVADGTLELEDYVVTGGTITVLNPSKVFIIGLPYEGSFDTLPLYGAYQGFNPLKPKSLTELHFRVYKSASIFAAQFYLSASGTLLDKPYVAKSTESKARLDEPYNTAPDLYTGLMNIPIYGTPEKDLQVRISQKKPMPLTVQAIHLEFK